MIVLCFGSASSSGEYARFLLSDPVYLALGQWVYQTEPALQWYGGAADGKQYENLSFEIKPSSPFDENRDNRRASSITKSVRCRGWVQVRVWVWFARILDHQVRFRTFVLSPRERVSIRRRTRVCVWRRA